MEREVNDRTGTPDQVDGHEIGEALKIVFDAVSLTIGRRPELAHAVLVLARAIQQEAEAPDKAEEAAPTQPETNGPGPEVHGVGAVRESDPVSPPELGTYELPAPATEPVVDAEPAWKTAQVDLGLVVQRARLKAQALDWAVQRRALLAAGCDFKTEVKPQDEELMGAARELQGCHLWMMLPHGAGDQMSDAGMAEVAAGYRAVAIASDAARDWGNRLDGPGDERARPALLALIAEAQSALMEGLRLNGVRQDADQRDLWMWVRQATDREQVYLDRHMNQATPANPAGLVDYADRLEALVNGFKDRRCRAKRRQTRLNSIKYHIKAIEDRLGGGVEPDDDCLNHDWQRVAEKVLAWVTDGDQVTDGHLLEAMARVADLMPEAYVEGHVAPVLEAVERWCDQRSEKPTGEEDGAGREEASAEGPANVAEAVDRILHRFPGRLALALNNRSSRDYPYARPQEVERALEWLATVVWEMRAHGKGTGDFRTLHHQLLECCGWFYRPGQSSTTIGRYPDWYRCTFEGRTLVLEEHIGRGSAKRGAHNVIRVAFAWDEPSGKIVVGFIGQHQKTTQT